MPMLRVFSSGDSSCHFLTPEKKEAVHPPPLSSIIYAATLPTIMRERPIGFGHSMGIFLFFNRRAAIVGRVDHLRRQFFFHRFFRPVTRGVNQPAHAQ